MGQADHLKEKWHSPRDILPLWKVAGLSGCLLFLSGCSLFRGVQSPDPMRFEAEVRELKRRNDSLREQDSPALVFTGSSSIRMWGDLQERFPGVHILNSGFGGSQASDLKYYLTPLVLNHRPVKVFIYGGDNDLAWGKRPGRVLQTLKEIEARIQENQPGTQVFFIGAKPSPSRWQFRGKYRRFNRKLKRWTGGEPLLHFADVWEPMLRSGQPDPALFLEDDLHMNSLGYDIWEAVLKPLVTLSTEKPNP